MVFKNIENQIPLNAETTLTRPGSISKLFTWVAVMQMVEQGKIDLDADVNNYLNTFQIENTFPRATCHHASHYDPYSRI